jgi:hypothetical protein
LKVIQRGKDLSHYEIVPKNPMPLERFIELLDYLYDQGFFNQFKPINNLLE